MQKDYEVVIADTSCFILLSKIGELELLHTIFGQVTTTAIIAKEFGIELPAWISCYHCYLKFRKQISVILMICLPTFYYWLVKAMFEMAGFK